MKKIKIHHLIIFICCLISGCKKHTPEPAPDKTDHTLAAYYSFNSSANDESANKSNGVVHGASLAADSLGQPNTAYQFNGVDNYITIPASSNLNIKDAITLSAWIKPVTTSGQYIIHKSAPTGGGGAYSLDIYPGTARAILYDTNSSYLLLSGTQAIRQNVWQHIALTWDGTNAKIFYNGVLDGSGVYTGKIDPSSAPVEIGTYPWGNTYYQGLIDNIRIYNRAMSDSEIQGLYSGYK